jgi:hypothetical protein
MRAAVLAALLHEVCSRTPRAHLLLARALSGLQQKRAVFAMHFDGDCRELTAWHTRLMAYVREAGRTREMEWSVAVAGEAERAVLGHRHNCLRAN